MAREGKKPMAHVEFDHDSQTIVTRGREAWQSLRNDETWEKWIEIGRAIEAGRNAIMRHLHTNQPKGRAWSETFGAWLQENEFDQIDKGVRSRLLTCLENLPAIEAWRQTLGRTLRLQLNHPNAVCRRWQTAKAMPNKDPGSTPPRQNRKDVEIMRLQGELDAAVSKLRAFEHDKISEGRDWDWQDTPQEIAQAMLRLYPDKAKRLGAALQNLAKSSAKKP
jgi:hypothetical protein